ncbi:MAG: hypothetical protein K2M98_07960 [Muribaculum sp.]|nr:hypothetical protein [Muribaculum sp.]
MKIPGLINILIVAVTLMVTVVACDSGRSRDAVPRRTAYPRVSLCDTIYSATMAGDVTLWVNNGAQLSAVENSGDSNSRWYDIEYPTYGAVVHLTVMRPADIATAMENRLQRIELNAGDSPATVTELSGKGVEGILVSTPQAMVTPLQLLATVRSHTVVSGAVEFTDTLYRGDAEARRPVVEALRIDLTRLIEGL